MKEQFLGSQENTNFKDRLKRGVGMIAVLGATSATVFGLTACNHNTDSASASSESSQGGGSSSESDVLYGKSCASKVAGREYKFMATVNSNSDRQTTTNPVEMEPEDYLSKAIITLEDQGDAKITDDQRVYLKKSAKALLESSPVSFSTSARNEVYFAMVNPDGSTPTSIEEDDGMAGGWYQDTRTVYQSPAVLCTYTFDDN